MSDPPGPALGRAGATRAGDPVGEPNTVPPRGVPPRRYPTTTGDRTIRLVAATTRKQEQSLATRAKLTRVARRLFARHGYGGTSIEEIVTRSKVTRGALYHHFASKQEIFQAVFEQVSQEVGKSITDAALAERRPERKLEAGCQAFLDACLERDVQRIMLLDAPAVLGLEMWHDVEGEGGVAILKWGLEATMEGGFIERQPVEPLAHMLLGALNEAGLAIATADDVPATRKQFGRTLHRLLAGLEPRG